MLIRKFQRLADLLGFITPSAHEPRVDMNYFRSVLATLIEVNSIPLGCELPKHLTDRVSRVIAPNSTNARSVFLQKSIESGLIVLRDCENEIWVMFFDPPQETDT